MYRWICAKNNNGKCYADCDWWRHTIYIQTDCWPLPTLRFCDKAPNKFLFNPEGQHTWVIIKVYIFQTKPFYLAKKPYLRLCILLCAVGFRSCESPSLPRFRTRVSTGWICPTAMSSWRRIPGRTAGKAGQVCLYHLAVYPSKGLVLCSRSGRRMSWYCCSGSAYTARLPAWCVPSSRSTLQAVNRISDIHNYEIKNYFRSTRDSSPIWVEFLPPPK